MSYRIAISFAVAAIGLSCIATEAISQRVTVAPAGYGGAAAPQMGRVLPKTAGYAGAAAPQMPGSPAGFGGAAAPQAGATGARYYAPTFDNGYNGIACGRFPFPPCKKAAD
jgi:hypothetical protein